MKAENGIMITQPTWMIHGNCNGERIIYCTDGLSKYNSLEIEMTLQLNRNQAMQFLNLIAFVIANGKTFKDGDIDESIFTCPIAFREVNGKSGNGERKLRVIFQDTNFKFPWEDGCEERFKAQI